EGFRHHSILCRLAATIGDNTPGEQVVIPRIPFYIDASETRVGVSFCRKQFPLRLAFAMTINRSQGQTLHKVGLYLRTDPFSHGQLYVGMSRARLRSNLRIVTELGTVKNVVWPEALAERSLPTLN
ncbi:hypothetical protein B1A_07570, partial [mine drainage metagenome]